MVMSEQPQARGNDKISRRDFLKLLAAAGGDQSSNFTRNVFRKQGACGSMRSRKGKKCCASFDRTLFRRRRAQFYGTFPCDAAAGQKERRGARVFASFQRRARYP